MYRILIRAQSLNLLRNSRRPKKGPCDEDPFPIIPNMVKGPWVTGKSITLGMRIK